VMNMETDYFYAIVNESELDQLMLGKPTGYGLPWTPSIDPPPLHPGSTGVLWKRGKDRHEAAAQPLVLVSREDDLRRLCGRYSQLRSDLSPLSTWCYVITPKFFPGITFCKANLIGLEAAWTGLVIAEAALLAEKPIGSLRISACLATQTFAVARAKALWNSLSTEEIIQRFDSANRLCRNESAAQREGSRAAKLRTALQPIWNVLSNMSGSQAHTETDLWPLSTALSGLLSARIEKSKEEARRLLLPLLDFIPEAEKLQNLTELVPESRLRVFDTLVDSLKKSKETQPSVRRYGLALLAGYLATIAAGGAPSLALAEANADQWPEITAWAYLVGGIGERIVWTSSFDGLGRLVARELMRPVRFDEPPTCDFSFDEAAVLVDAKLSDPLVHLRVKQARIVNVSLVPGVNISIPISDASIQEQSKLEAVRQRPQGESIFISHNARDPLGPLLAELVWPHLKGRVEETVRVSGRSHTSSKRKSKSQQDLPLSSSKTKNESW